MNEWARLPADPDALGRATTATMHSHHRRDRRGRTEAASRLAGAPRASAPDRRLGASNLPHRMQHGVSRGTGPADGQLDQSFAPGGGQDETCTRTIETGLGERLAPCRWTQVRVTRRRSGNCRRASLGIGHPAVTTSRARPGLGKALGADEGRSVARRDILRADRTGGRFRSQDGWRRGLTPFSRQTA